MLATEIWQAGLPLRYDAGMARTISKKGCGGPAPNRAIRNILRNFEASNRAENRYIHRATIERQVRALIQRDYPDLAPTEVEKRVARRMEHGFKDR